MSKQYSYHEINIQYATMHLMHPNKYHDVITITALAS